MAILYSLAGVLLLGLSLPAHGKPGDPFQTADEAALDAIDFLMKEHPDWKKYEYAGCIYKEGDAYKASLPVTQYLPKRCQTPQAPAGTVIVGDYHSHTSKEDFSPQVDLNTKNTWPLYLLTPSEHVKNTCQRTRKRWF